MKGSLFGLGETMRATVVMAFWALWAGAAHADVIYVDANVSSGGDGTSWTRAYDSLTRALDAASPGDQLWVAKNLYVPDSPLGRDATFLIPDGVGVYGGFSGRETSFDEREPVDNPSILDGADNSYHVVTFDGSSAVLDGFIIERGLADGTATLDQRGAGIFATDAAPILRNLVVRDCVATNLGAAMYFDGTPAGFVTLDACTISDNGSEVAVWSSLPINATNTLFSGNPLGASELHGTGPHIFTDCEFVGNGGGGVVAGGAWLRMDAGSLGSLFLRCTFRNNTGAVTGVIHFGERGDHEVVDCVFQGNENLNGSTSSAGAISCAQISTSDSVLIESCLFTGNRNLNNSTGAGTIAKIGSGVLTILGCTLTGNDKVNASASDGIVVSSGQAFLYNTIIWGNISTGTNNGGRSIIVGTGAAVDADRVIIEGYSPLTSLVSCGVCLSTFPSFVDANGPDDVFGTPDDNVRLMPGSPAIDAGNSLRVGPLVSSDIYDQPRYADDPGTPDTGVSDGLNPIVDIGAAEFQGTTPTLCPADVDGNGLLNLDDIDVFVAAFLTGDLLADLDTNGTLNFDDIDLFVASFLAGCP